VKTPRPDCLSSGVSQDARANKGDAFHRRADDVVSMQIRSLAARRHRTGHHNQEPRSFVSSLWLL